MSYRDQLNDPRWERRSKEIKIRDSFRCQRCDSNKNLNVHHLRYERGKKAWEYKNEYLITLCNNCHLSEHHYQWLLNSKIQSMRESGLMTDEIMKKFNVKF